jgi:SAM-dependent methyltransferase
MYPQGVAATATTPEAPYRITQSSRRLVGTIRRCEGCGLGVLPQDLGDLAHYVEGHDERFAEQAAVRIRNAERLLQLLPPPATGMTLFDVGCAYGFLLVAARNLGYVPRGIEISEAAAAYARRTYELDVLTGSIEDARLGAESLDVVTLADVIEHLTAPAAVIDRIHGLLKPGGRLLILTPDLESLAARALGRHWWALLDDHYFYFSRYTLPRFLARHGFAVESLRSFGRAFPVHHWVYKLSQYSRGAHRAVDAAVRAVGLANVEVPLNLGDQMACVARRR